MLTVAGCKFRIRAIPTSTPVLFMAPKRSGQVVILEPEGFELLEEYPQIAQRFRDVGWFEFITTFQGYEEQVSMEFA